MKINTQRRIRIGGRGFTLPEVIISIALATIMVAGVVAGYIQSTDRAEWSAYSLAAHSLAMQRLEQARAAKWDTLKFPVVDDLQQTNFPDVVEILDIPIAGTNIVYATL